MSNGYLLLHGWQNRRPEDHWHHWLSRRLVEAGHHVAYPQLPDPDEPVLDEWLATLAEVFAGLEGDERVIVAHSLGAVTTMHAMATTDLQERADRVLLVAPPSASVMNDNLPIAGFVLPERIGVRVQTRLVGSDADPYCPEGVAEFYGSVLDLDAAAIDVVPGGGHLSLDDGYGAWPSVLEWCLDPAARLTGNREAS